LKLCCDWRRHKEPVLHIKLISDGSVATWGSTGSAVYERPMMAVNDRHITTDWRLLSSSRAYGLFIKSIKLLWPTNVLTSVCVWRRTELKAISCWIRFSKSTNSRMRLQFPHGAADVRFTLRPFPTICARWIQPTSILIIWAKLQLWTMQEAARLRVRFPVRQFDFSFHPISPGTLRP
jgi:hypothetical protein